ncbi:MAG: hypothetical protein AAFQ98_09370 [Bacteroidota bacterium]
MKQPIFLLSAIVVLASCDNLSQKIVEGIEVDNLIQVRDTGLIAADGCGWTVFTDGTYFTVQEWDSNLQVDGLYIAASLTKTGETLQCGLDPNSSLEEVTLEMNSSDYTILYYQKTQCADPWVGTDLAAIPEVEEMIAYLAERDIDLLLAQDVPMAIDGGVCLACDCPAQSFFRVGVTNADVPALLDLGFIEEQPTLGE